jgi:CHAD domain-containing protein
MAFDQDRVAQLFEKLDRQLTRLSSKPQPKNIHQFRTAARRVETALAEIIPEQDRKQRKLLKLVSKLRRRAGKVRDIDVQVAALRSLKVSERPGLKTQILQAMSEMRAKRERRFLDTLDRETVRGLRRRLQRGQARFPESAPDPRVLVTGMLAAFANDSGPMTEKLLHQYRIQGKKIRYIAELAGDQPDAQRTIEELKRMQDALGEWHDWLTLNATVTKLLPDNVSSPLRAAISNITRAKYRDAVQAVASARANLSKQTVAEVRLPAQAKRSIPASTAPARAVA